MCIFLQIYVALHNVNSLQRIQMFCATYTSEIFHYTSFRIHLLPAVRNSVIIKFITFFSLNNYSPSIIISFCTIYI